MVDCRLFASVPFGNTNAWQDFVGTHDLYWRALSEQIKAVTGVQIRTYPLGNGGGPNWLARVQQQYQNATTALGLPSPPDLETYSLDQAGDFASWTWIISQTLRQISRAAGLN